MEIVTALRVPESGSGSNPDQSIVHMSAGERDRERWEGCTYLIRE